MILADENIDHRIIQAIRGAGFEVYSIYESNRGCADEDIIEFSRNPPRIILTEDKDLESGFMRITLLELVYSFCDIVSLKPSLLLRY
jgi:predicted nuclease of predicted toxin-antitoxin system